MDGITVKEAAAHFDVSERTIRRRIKDGHLKATQLPTSQGFEWRIHLDNAAHIDKSAVQLDGAPTQAEPHPTPTNDSTLIRALDLVEKLQRENLELAGRVGFYQAKLQDAQEQIRLLTAPKDQEQPKTAWWRKLISR